VRRSDSGAQQRATFASSLLPMSCLIISLVACRQALAAPMLQYSFYGELEIVDSYYYGDAVHVGDPFVATLLVDSTARDLDPSPNRGSYRALRLDCYSGATEIFSFNELHFLDVAAWNNYPSGDSFGGAHLVFNIYAWVTLSFPGDTFSSDALPTSVDASLATSTQMQFLYTFVLARGKIHSATVEAIPEPEGVAGFAVLCWMLRRRRIGVG
jgi:hypothetical protein